MRRTIITLFLFLLGLSTIATIYQSWCIVTLGHAARPRAADVIIVLGPRLQGDRMEELGLARARAAARFWREGHAPVILASGGTVPPGTIPEGEALRRELIAAGVDSDCVFVESGSHSTMENLEAARELMSAHRWRSALIVSNPFHLRRTQVFASRLGIDASVAGDDAPNLDVLTRAWWFCREVAASVYYGIW